MKYIQEGTNQMMGIEKRQSHITFVPRCRFCKWHGLPYTVDREAANELRTHVDSSAHRDGVLRFMVEERTDWGAFS